MISEEQLKELHQEISGELDNLSDLERPLTKEEGKHRKKLQFRKYVLDRIKEAKDKDQKSDELYNTEIQGSDLVGCTDFEHLNKVMTGYLLKKLMKQKTQDNID